MSSYVMFRLKTNETEYDTIYDFSRNTEVYSELYEHGNIPFDKWEAVEVDVISRAIESLTERIERWKGRIIFEIVKSSAEDYGSIDDNFGFYEEMLDTRSKLAMLRDMCMTYGDEEQKYEWSVG